MHLFAFVPVAVSMASAVSAGGHSKRGPSTAHRHRNIHVPRNTQYNLTTMYKGQSLLDDFNFFTGSDPTNGKVNFLSQKDASSKGLAYVDGNNVTVLAVDDSTQLSSGQNRNSVRISSKKTFNGGLFIADFAAMPTGCATWPAWWSTGPDWPNAGEIDVVEGVNGKGTNQMTLHTGSSGSCTLDNSTNSNKNNLAFTGNVLGTQCQSSQQSNAGCGVTDPDARSFAEGFNNATGGVFAHLWDSQGIKIWHFAREDIPKDITSNSPNPDSWPTPAASWASATCNIGDNFHDHGLTLDTTLCGGWADGAYASSGCPGTCEDAVADPKNFADAKWKVNYIAVYNGVTSN